MNYLCTNQIRFERFFLEGTSHRIKVAFISRRLVRLMVRNWCVRYEEIDYDYDYAGYKPVLVSLKDGTVVYVKKGRGNMRSAAEFKSLAEVSEMAAQSLSPDEYKFFRDVHDVLVLRRSIQTDVLNDYTIDKNVSCVTCKSYGSAWIYCPILKQMLDIESFDKTGELHGCNAHNESGTIFSESRHKYFWQCKYCGENEKPKCHKCVRGDGKVVSDELN